MHKFAVKRADSQVSGRGEMFPQKVSLDKLVDSQVSGRGEMFPQKVSLDKLVDSLLLAQRI